MNWTSYSFDEQHTREFISTLSTDNILTCLELLSVLLDDLRTFRSFDGLERDLQRWYNANLTLYAERTVPLEQLEGVANYRFIRYLAFRVPLNEPVVRQPQSETTAPIDHQE